MEKYLLVQTSCSTRKEAETLAESVVQARLAACAQLIPSITSIYRWQGAVERNEEMLVLVKTRKEHLHALFEWISDRHSYEVPEIIAFPISAGSSDYLAWIDKETR
ncbi:divalent-cation tolerance protein CutA [candidate division KSB1 bacterium]|nr:divalent-cation tolerance protein CutA [candidate division KSB1 bacterium]